MSREQNKATVRRLYDEVVNQENKAVIDEIFAPNAIFHDPFSGTQHGVENFKQLLAMFDTAFPHHRVTVHEVMAEGEYVTVLHTHHARHTGPLMGIPATGKELHINGVEVLRMQDGRIAEFWRHDDDAGMLMQLGILQMPAPAIA